MKRSVVQDVAIDLLIAASACAAFFVGDAIKPAPYFLSYFFLAFMIACSSYYLGQTFGLSYFHLVERTGETSVFKMRKPRVKPLPDWAPALIMIGMAWLITVFIAFNIIFYSAFVESFRLLLPSSVLLTVIAFATGASISVELKLESENKLEQKPSASLRASFDHSLRDYLPFLCACLFVYMPLDYLLFVVCGGEKLWYYAAVLILGAVLLVFLFRRKRRSRLFAHLEIDRRRPIIGHVVSFISGTIALVGAVFYGFANDRVASEAPGGKGFAIAMLILTGLVPLRLLQIFLERQPWWRKLLSLVPVAFFIILLLVW